MSPRVLEAQGSLLTNKYADGYPGERHYARLRARRRRRAARDRARAAALRRRLRERAAVLGLASEPRRVPRAAVAGRHAARHAARARRPSHARRRRESVGLALQRRAVRRRGDAASSTTTQIAALARKHRPKLVVAGFSAYSRVVDWARFRAIADDVGALFLADIAHVAGLVVAGLYPNPVAARRRHDDDDAQDAARAARRHDPRAARAPR